MERLYAPWRCEYVTQEKIEGCVFCQISKNIDNKTSKVIFNDDLCYVVMNKYPYSPGHIMIIPHFHTNNIEDLSSEIWQQMSLRVKQGVKMLKEIMPCEGVNIGMNLGEIAGAGIAEHVHYHLLPRWRGDTNFISTIGNIRVYPVDFEKIFERLKNKAKEYFL